MPTQPRRTPTQARSRAMVERILDAGARVLIADGYQRASTNRIARAAGISPGSLYQYFADKDAIIAAITARLVEDFAAEIAPALRETTSLQPLEAVPSMLAASLDALQRRATLLRGLVDHVPASEQRATLHAVSERLTDRVRAGLAATRHDDVERATWLIVELTQHLLVCYVLDAPAIQREELLADLNRMIFALI